MQEHRGFGFVTFETEAAIQRVVSHGAHRLKGAQIAIDIAMPKVGGEQILQSLCRGRAQCGQCFFPNHIIMYKILLFPILWLAKICIMYRYRYCCLQFSGSGRNTECGAPTTPIC